MNRLVFYVLVPLAFVLCGILGRLTMKGRDARVSPQDFHFSVDAALGGLLLVTQFLAGAPGPLERSNFAYAIFLVLSMLTLSYGLWAGRRIAETEVDYFAAKAASSAKLPLDHSQKPRRLSVRLREILDWGTRRHYAMAVFLTVFGDLAGLLCLVSALQLQVKVF